MIKLMYNNIKKDIEVINKKIGIKNFLEKNKIYFETIVMVFLTIMSIVISVVGLRIDKRNQEISQKELEIIENDREPYFKIECDSNYVNNKNFDDYIMKKKYTITNTGGSIYGAYIMVKPMLEIWVPKERAGEYDIFTYMLPEMLDENAGIMYLYEETSKTFTFYEYESSEWNNIIKHLQSGLRNFLGNESIVLLVQNYIDMTYVNYKNEHYDIRYNFLDDRLILQDKQSKSIYLGPMYSDDIATMIAKTHIEVEDALEEKYSSNNIE